MKILAVDDNPENVELINDILATSGYMVIPAKDGPTALALAESHEPDLVLLDVNMPGMDGFEVCTRLKSNDKTAHIPVIMVTAMNDVDYRVRGLTVGADDYLSKPFSPRELIARTERSIRNKLKTDTLLSTQEILRNTFERFVAPSVVEQLLKNPQQVKLGGTLQQITVLFADLEGFTSLSEKSEPVEILQLLNNYHSLIVKVIQFYGGTVDKFLGDGVMALYNTPVQQDDHIDRAVKTALHIQDEVHWFQQNLPEEHRMKINFGIHSGSAIVGNVGTENLMDFTAIGDTVNVSARLQGVADGGRIYVSEYVYEQAGDYIVGRTRGTIQVKGRTQAVSVYEISNTAFID